MSQNKVPCYIAITLVFAFIIGLSPSVTLAATKQAQAQISTKKIPNIFTATIENISGTTITAKMSSTEKTVKVVTNRSTKYSGKDKVSSLKQLKAGAKVTIRGSYDAKKNVFNAQVISLVNANPAPVGKKAGISGTIESVGTNTISIRTSDNSVKTFNVQKARIFTVDNKIGTLSSLTTGNKVTIITREDKTSSTVTATLIRQTSR